MVETTNVINIIVVIGLAGLAYTQKLLESNQSEFEESKKKNVIFVKITRN